MIRAGALAVFAVLSAAAGVQAQQTVSAVTPDTSTVGGVVRVAVRVEVGAGVAVVLPDTLPLQEPLENAGVRRTRIDTLSSGLRVTAVYPVTAWRPGAHQLPPVEVALTGQGGARNVQVALPQIIVRSVLPKDTAGIEPKPAKAVVGRSWLLWPFVLIALLLAVVLALLVRRWLRRRRQRPRETQPEVSPRERALAFLDAARVHGTPSDAELEAFYVRVSDALRHYVAELHPRWGTDLTSGELVARMRSDGHAAEAASLGALLDEADLVKFARRRSASAEAEAHWRAARTFVERFDGPAPAPAPELEEAA